MEHLIQKSKCSILHNIFKYMVSQRRQKELFRSKALNQIDMSTSISRKRTFPIFGVLAGIFIFIQILM